MVKSRDERESAQITLSSFALTWIFLIKYLIVIVNLKIYKGARRAPYIEFLLSKIPQDEKYLTSYFFIKP